jgi:hypothetical protein
MYVCVYVCMYVTIIQHDQCVVLLRYIVQEHALLLNRMLMVVSTVAAVQVRHLVVS